MEGLPFTVTSQLSEMRQVLARARGDLDLLNALEEAKPPHARDVLGMAARMLDAGRAADALDCARRPEGRPGPTARDPLVPARVTRVARILGALGEAAEAQTLRRRCFETHLDADILREHLKRLPDSEDMEAEERAMAFASDHANADAALRFFMGWPRHDRAARLIVARRDRWSARDWHHRPIVADALHHEHPLVATSLYRALLNDILAPSIEGLRPRRALPPDPARPRPFRRPARTRRHGWACGPHGKPQDVPRTQDGVMEPGRRTRYGTGSRERAHTDMGPQGVIGPPRKLAHQRQCCGAARQRGHSVQLINLLRAKDQST